jgi:hypothetical protein
MSTPGTTDLADLPALPLDGEPVQLHTRDKNVVVENQAAQLQEMREQDTKDMNSFVTGIQEASAAGALRLPQRDVPQNQEHLTQDQQIRANYVPAYTHDYIGEGPTSEDIISQHATKQKTHANVDNVLDMLQVPIILSILYFAFQMPVMRKFVFEKLPFLFAKDGNPTTIGSAIVSVAFAGAYMGLTHTLEYLSI